ncbi:helicase-associated domain-containing protein [Amycolatopsis taiwanensis]|nr:helicase-associated domain-containing protein [Amycolatopsis taiwanensis]
MPATSLADWLRSKSDDELAALLAARRDLATPPPATSMVLATRAGSAGSTARALEDLDTFTLAVLDALLLTDADTEAVPADAVAALLGADPAPALDRLRARAIAWGDDDALRVVPVVRDLLGPFPAGLGASVPELAGADLESIGEDERAVLHTLAAGPPIGRTRDANSTMTLAEATTPIQRLLARGLLVRRDDGTVELPRELGIALRGGRSCSPGALAEPELPTTPPQPSTVDTAGAGEAMEFLRQTEALLALWSAEPPPVLKAGGLGVRELRRLARELEVDDRRAALLVELAAGAGLVADSQTTTPEWVPTTLTDSWLASAPGQRWLTIAQTWLDLPRLPGLAGQRDAKDRVMAPLSEELRRPLAPVARRRVLDALADLPPGVGVRDTEDLVAVLAWRAPRRGGRLRDETVRQTIAEAAVLGVTALGAVTTATRALLADDRGGALASMVDAMPKPIDHILVQADLTVIAPGPMEPELATDVKAVADLESAGHATVYRVTEDSVRRALDAGRTADELHELFRTRSATGVPQSLSYLIDDVARRHGRLRGGAAASFLRCDDEVLLAEVLGGPVAAEYELRRIAPTVAVSPLPLAEVLDGLRAAGFAPAAEGPDGRVLDLRPSGRRIPARARATRRAATEPPVDPEQVTAVLAHLRAGDRAATSRKGAEVRLPGGGGGSDTAATMALLARASREQREVWIGYVDSHGTATQRVITPAHVGGGVLMSTDDQRYPLHRITSAALVED